MADNDLRLRLLIKSTETADLDGITICINDEKWHLAEFNYEATMKCRELPSFACISYRWYGGREPNPFYEGKLMSDMTLPSLTTAVLNSNVSAFWIDAFCVPPEGILKRRTLENMGLIYHLATEVLVVLSGCNSETAKLIAGTDDLTSQPFSAIDRAVHDLNADEWVKSIWTYQECVNSRNYTFLRSGAAIAEAAGTDLVVDGRKFFNRLGQALSIYRKGKKLNEYDMSRFMPHVHALEDLMADYELSDFSQRSALQVLSNLDRRYCQDSMDFFYSLIGSITSEIIARPASLTIAEVCETFIHICEKKNDFSFIYTSAPRNNRPGGRRCYPIAGPIHSILPWHSWGERQRGKLDQSGLSLEAMISLEPSTTLGSAGKTFILQWQTTIPARLPDQLDGDSDLCIAIRTFAILQLMLFGGSVTHVLTSHGIFFPEEPVEGISKVLVSTDIVWTFGAPGLVKAYSENEVRYMPGVFVGQLVIDIASLILLEGTNTE
ncbi:hypothetical protein FOXYSP1_06381 [Fusarium oxysporum f. sp. phaseoli]